MGMELDSNGLVYGGGWVKGGGTLREPNMACAVGCSCLGFFFFVSKMDSGEGNGISADLLVKLTSVFSLLTP